MDSYYIILPSLRYDHTIRFRLYTQARAIIMSDIKICTQISIDSQLADELSVQENPQNSPYPTGYDAQTYGQHLAAPVGRLWRNKRNIRVRILNGSKKVKRKIREYAEQWNNYSGVKFVFVDSGESEVRVNVNGSYQTWSCIGTECLTIPQDQATMNFGWLTDTTQEIEFARTILHEFGHALGCIHEHQSPLAEIPWDKPRVYQYYATHFGWSTDLVDRNIFNYYYYPHMRASQFDRLSIMTYAIPASLTTSGFFTAANTRLSRSDREFIAYLYPPDNTAT